MAINCAAIPDQLLESALFGHQRGAFTGAHRDHIGVFEQASGGTLFLDEIGEMPLAMQAKLLRVLEMGQVRRVGDQVDRAVDVRVVCATHRDLAALVEAGEFRADLRYRLDGATIALPPLRERGDDLVVLAHHFLRAACVAQARRVPGFSTAALACLAAYPFPGNLRELRNEIARALALTDDGLPIEPQAFSDRLNAQPAAPVDGSLKAQVLATERRAAQAALTAHAGQVSAAARSLGISRAGLYKLMARVGLSD